jgi:wyosine [tRNA(Phe)-imidazoG37] synthetase (radical SAM superfamily)
MSTFLFHNIIFGPIYSRRMGQSLGLNLLPVNSKICTFNCIYCECGWTESHTGDFVSVDDFEKALTVKLKEMKANGTHADAFTFAGNGEPTLHPHFEDIIDLTIALRNKYISDADIVVLSNSTTLSNLSVVNALKKVDKNIMKLDTCNEFYFKIINQPNANIHLRHIVENLMQFDGKLIIQTMLVKGEFSGVNIDNYTNKDLSLLGKCLQNINPHTLMLYSVSRDTPAQGVIPLTKQELTQASNTLSQYIPNCSIEIY